LENIDNTMQKLNRIKHHNDHRAYKNAADITPQHKHTEKQNELKLKSVLQVIR